jgi:hypothetical protein
MVVVLGGEACLGAGGGARAVEGTWNQWVVGEEDVNAC